MEAKRSAVHQETGQLGIMVKAGVVRRPRLMAVLVAAAIILVAVFALLLRNGSPRETRKAYAAAARDYIMQLQADGLTLARKVAPEDGGDAFLFLLISQTGEILDSEIQDAAELIFYSARVFEARRGLRSDDIFVWFQRPVAHSIILVDRPDGLPSPLGLIGEFTITDDESTGIGWSVVNLAATVEDLGREFSIAWSVIQAVCLSYVAHHLEDADPSCNIIAANAAAGWTGIDRAVAESWLGAGGTTGLGYLGSRDYDFRFIESVYDEFLHE